MVVCRLVLMLMLLGAWPVAGQTASQADAVEAIADEYLAALRAMSPDHQNGDRDTTTRHDRLRDVSAAAEQAWRAREDEWLARLRALDGEIPLGDPAWVTYRLLRERLESRVALRVCNTRLWTVHPLIGWQAEYAALAARQPVDTPEHREQALTRWRQLPRLIDQEIANLREGVAAGYTAPKPNVRRVLVTLDRLVATSPTDSPFFSPAARDSNPEFRAAFERLVADEITPAVRRYRDYLADEYLAVARDEAGLSGHPEGAACFRAAIQYYTTLDLSGEEVHHLMVDALAEAESTLAAVAATLDTASGGASEAGDVRALMQRLRYAPGMTFTSRDAMRAAIDTIIDRVWAVAPRWFTRLPTSSLSVEPFPAFQEGSTPTGQYLPPDTDGSRGGVFRVSFRSALMPGMRSMLEHVVMHEAVPGHHLQISLARERPGAHPISHRLGSSALAEGWAIYAEHLADEMELYSSPASRLHVLDQTISALASAVAETGLHAMGWSRPQAIEYLLRHARMSQSGAAAAVDRAAGWPGQGLAYMVGYLEIRRLRNLAERELGERFDVREFHARALESGTITLPMLREKIEAWVRVGR